MQIIFQNPYESLNSRMTVVDIIAEPLRLLKLYRSDKEVIDRVTEVLEEMGLTPPEEYLNRYPHQLSGGQRQRVGIARAFGPNPKFVVADEPVAGLEDVPTITSVFPEYKKYLPWGPFYGVWAKKGLPEDTKQKLVEAFKKSFEEPDFQQFLDDFGAISMGLSGEEADQFLKHWQSVSCWMIYEAGGAKESPEKFGILKVE